MSLDEFGLGDWWPRPDQAAVGALDHLPSDQWSMLAARWLAAGFDSPLLRQLAQLPRADRRNPLRRASRFAYGLEPGQPLPVEVQRFQDRRRAAMEARDLMPDVLRSIGFDPAPADQAFLARCQGALDIVQRDLDMTGYGQYQMRARFGQGWPASVYPALPDGSYWGGGQGVTREADGPWLLAATADSASATLKEIPEIEWPVCAIHGGHPTSIWDGEDPVGLIGKVAWWQCTNTGHPLAPVGQLSGKAARTL